MIEDARRNRAFAGKDSPSLESLVEAEDLGLEILHPGGTDVTRELARLAGITPGTTVLEVAAGTGETARLLSTEFGARVTAVDVSPLMIARERRKLLPLQPAVRIVLADAHRLPFRAGSFDVAISECAVCHFDKLLSLTEMARVVRPGGRVGIHDLAWKEGTPEALKRRLADIEREAPETIPGWAGTLERAGLVEVRVLDRSQLMAAWTRNARRTLGLLGYLKIVVSVLTRWGLAGLRTVFESERIFASPYLGYALMLGVKR